MDALTKQRTIKKLYDTPRWKTMFGKKEDEIPANIRREQWECWKEAARKVDASIVERWDNPTYCEGCINKDDDWCNRAGLPCTVNPLLTFQHNIPGMACMGKGYEPKTKKAQKNIKNKGVSK